MDTHRPEDFARTIPVLPPGIAVCEGLPRAKWYLKAVTLRSNDGVDVAKALCQNTDPTAVDDTVDLNAPAVEPLGDDKVFVQIAESLCELEVPSGWMWSIHSWDIKLVILDGVSLFDHYTTHLYNMAVKDFKK
jgi:hypothetical protein